MFPGLDLYYRYRSLHSLITAAIGYFVDDVVVVVLTLTRIIKSVVTGCIDDRDLSKV